jgi:phosphoglycolate phosphatase-like HAD superfamily hydrolase
MGLKVVYSDAGGIIVPSPEPGRQTNSIVEFFRREHGRSLDPFETKKLLRPYLDLAQTVMPEREALSLFFEQVIRESLSEKDYLAIRITTPECDLRPAITPSLEKFNSLGVPFYLVSDAQWSASEMAGRVERQIVSQLKKRGVYDPSEFRFEDYVSGIVSSRDVGAKKPNPRIFDAALALVPSAAPREAVFVAHASDEIFGALDYGMNAIVAYHCNEKDRAEIEVGVRRRREEREAGKPWVEIVKGFSGIAPLISTKYHA